jgi:hypothetical protein
MVSGLLVVEVREITYQVQPEYELVVVEHP